MLEMTVEGCKKAEQYLIDNDLMEEFKKERSVDGYSMVYFVNEHMRKVMGDVFLDAFIEGSE